MSMIKPSVLCYSTYGYFIIMVQKKRFLSNHILGYAISYPWPNLMAHTREYYVVDK